jgi:hypothetical protein
MYFCEQPDQALVSAADCINSLKGKSKLVERKMQDRHSIVPKVCLIVCKVTRVHLFRICLSYILVFQQVTNFRDIPLIPLLLMI